MKHHRSDFFRNIAFAALLASLAAPALAEDPGAQLVLTDTRGDRGMLAPFVHGRNGVSYLYTSYLFDTLIGQDKAGLPTPELARDWVVSPDGLVVDLHLDLRAHWHDGSPVTARDAAFTFGYMQDHPYVFASLRNVQTAQALSDEHLRITLKTPDAGIVSGLLLSMPMLPEHIYQEIKTPMQFSDLKAATGSGPYQLVDYNKAQGRYLLEATPEYYLGQPRFQRIAIVKMGTDAALQAMAAGDVDAIPYLPPERAKQALRLGLSVVTSLSHHMVRLGFNHHGRFGNKTLRQALAYSIDRKSVVATAFHDTAEIAEVGYFQPGSAWFSQAEHEDYSFDPAQSERLFMAAGWSRDAKGRWQQAGEVITLRLIAGKTETKPAKVIASQLEAFGLQTELRILERATLKAGLEEIDYDLTLYSSSTLGDPNGLLRRVFGQGWPSDGYSGAALKSLATAQSTARTKPQRQRLLDQFQAGYAEELPSYAIANPYMAAAYTQKLGPLQFIPGGAAIGVPTALHKSYLIK